MSNIYLVERDEAVGYDEYDSFVVTANNEVEARQHHPNDGLVWSKDDQDWFMTHFNGNTSRETSRSWCEPEDIDDLIVTQIGIAVDSQPKGTLISSFNAG